MTIWVAVNRVGLWIARFRLFVVGGACLMACPIIASAGTGTNSVPDTDKSNYNLFNPVPTALLREMNTDRPDITESPYIVDASHYQLEKDLVNFTYDHDTASGADWIGLAEGGLTYAVTENVQLDACCNFGVTAAAPDYQPFAGLSVRFYPFLQSDCN